MKKNIILVTVLCLCFANSFAQTILWDSTGDKRLTFLQGVNRMNVAFSFYSVMINGKTENEFLEKRQDEFNDKKKGRGDDFVGHWQEVKGKRYPSHFLKSFKKTAKKKMKISEGNDLPYKLIVRLSKAKTGEGIYVKTKPAVAEFQIQFVETSSGKVLASGRILNCKGMAKAKSNLGSQGQVLRIVAAVQNTDVANRIAQCYDVAATATAKYVIRYNKEKNKAKR